MANQLLGKRKVGDTVLLKKKDMHRLVEVLADEYDIFGPVRKDGQVVFSRIAKAPELAYYVNSMMSPKKYLHRPSEIILSGHIGDGFFTEESIPDKKQVLIAVKPCDVHAILYLDKVFNHDFQDPYYNARREKTFIVGLNCTEVGENCFCSSFDTGPELKEGYDLLLTNLGDRYTVDVGSEAGAEIVERIGLEDAHISDTMLKLRKIRVAREQMSKRLDTKDLPQILRANLGHIYWSQVGQECLGCSNCTMVCPTCYCYNVVDQVDISLKNVERIRSWDSCQVLDFAAVSGGNFRKEQATRIKQFVCHKLSYSLDQYGLFGCVGCGRCITWCPAEIDITKVAQEIRGGES